MNRRLVIAGLLALVLIGVVSLVRALMPDTRFIYGTVAAGPEEALLLTRRNEDHSTAFWIEHVDLAGQLRWSVELSPLEPDEALGFTSAAAADDRVIVLGEREGEGVALALDRASGRRLWETVLPRTDATGGPIGPMVIIDGPRVYLIRQASGERGLADRIDAVSLADGAALWAHEAGESADVHLLAPGRLMLRTLGGGGGKILAGATGEVTQQLDRTRILCAVPDGLLANELGAAVLVPAAADGPRWRDELEAPWRVDFGPCGVRGEDPVLGTRSREDEHVGLVRIDRGTGLPRWQLDLETTQAEPLLTLDGRLPRFLPVAVYGGGEGPIVNELVIVDLDAGVLVSRATIGQHVEVLATPERAWIWVQFRNTLAGLDPATGQLGRATAFRGLSANHIRRDDLQFGVLWLYGMDWARPAALPWVAVDLATGEVLRAAASLVPRDETAAIGTMLGG